MYTASVPGHGVRWMRWKPWLLSLFVYKTLNSIFAIDLAACGAYSSAAASASDFGYYATYAEDVMVDHSYGGPFAQKLKPHVQ